MKDKNSHQSTSGFFSFLLVDFSKASKLFIFSPNAFRQLIQIKQNGKLKSKENY